MVSINKFRDRSERRFGIPSNNRESQNHSPTQRKIQELRDYLSLNRGELQATTTVSGEEDGGGFMVKPGYFTQVKPGELQATTTVSGEEDGGGFMVKPGYFTQVKPGELQATTTVSGEEDNQKNLYSAIRSNFPPNKNNFNITFNSNLS